MVAIAASVVLTSWFLGLYSFISLTGPLFNPRREIQFIRDHTPKYYIADNRSSTLYSYCQRTTAAIREGRIDDARRLAGQGSKLDPDNPLFDYLLAAAAAADDDIDSAKKSIARGNAKGDFVLYSTIRSMPDRWSRSETMTFNHAVRQLVKASPGDLGTLLAVYDLAQKLVFCRPADPSVFSSGLFLRRYVAIRITMADKGRLTPEARQYFEGASQVYRSVWQPLDEVAAHFDFNDPQAKVRMAMSVLRQSGGSEMDRYNMSVLSMDIDAERTERYRQSNIRPRPSDIFEPGKPGGPSTGIGRGAKL